MNIPLIKNPIKQDKEVPLLLRLLAILTFFGCVAVNGVIGMWGPKTASQVSDEFKLFVTPPGFIFIIWGAIYTLLLITIIYVSYKNIWPSKAYWLFMISNTVNAAWVGVWSIGTKEAVTICFFIILLLPICLLSLWVNLYDSNEESWSYYAIRNVIAFYLGWVLAATIINFGIVLVYDLSISQSEFTIIFWILVPLLTIGATIMNTMMQGVNGLKSCFCLWISVLWGLSGALITTLDNK